MGWFNKKENVPEIPPAPKLPDLPELPEIGTEDSENSIDFEENQEKELPSLPNTSFGEELNNEFVRSDVNEEEESLPLQDNGLVIQELPKDFRLGQRERIPSIPDLKNRRKIYEQPERKTLELSPLHRIEPAIKTNEPVFVRIDKFQQAQKDFNDIKNRLKDIEETLRKFKEVKFQEDAEVSLWAQNLEKIKSRLDSIESQIFSKI